MIALCLVVFFVTGTVVALALLRGGRYEQLTGLPPILRTEPRERSYFDTNSNKGDS